MAREELYTEMIRVRVSPEMKSRTQAIVELRKRTESEIIRDAIELYLAKVEEATPSPILRHKGSPV
jgi:predicted DNA-binding protein